MGGNSRRHSRIAVAAGTVAVAGAGIAMGAYAFGGANTSGLAPIYATPATHVAQRPTQTRRLAIHTSARPTVRRTATASVSFEGKLSLHDGLVKLKVLRVVGSASNSRTSLQLLERKAILAIGPRVQILDARGVQVPLSLLDDAIARVHGRLLPTASWRWSDDELRPVISVRRIVVLRLDPDVGD